MEWIQYIFLKYFRVPVAAIFMGMNIYNDAEMTSRKHLFKESRDEQVGREFMKDDRERIGGKMFKAFQNVDTTFEVDLV